MGGYNGDLSRSFAESNFRELDDVFLQTQTRIWLGEVLNMRLDEHIDISDLLADGDLLFEVSKILWNMLLAKCGELRHMKYEPLGSRRCSGRYLPYSNVDSFLKICKILGLNGIDLFSPSDVVEKKNIRKVCICLRALSNKARSKQLKVPDFDSVTYTVAMPKNMVGGIRRSLETSQSSLSSSSGYYSYKETRSKLMERNKISESEANYDSSSEESDEAESKFVGEESCCSSMNQLEDDNATDSDVDNSFGEYSAVGKNGREKNRTSRGNGRKYIRANDRIHFDYSDLNVENDASVVGDSVYDNEMEGSCISNYLSFSDSIIGGTDGSTPVLRRGEENILNFFMAMESDGPNSGERTFQNGHQHKYSDNEDAEVSSTTSMSSLLCRVQALDFDYQFDADECLTEETSGSLLENEADRQHKDSSASHKAWNVATNELSSHDTKEPSVGKPKSSYSLSELTYSCSDELLSASTQPLTDKFVSLHRNGSNYFDTDESKNLIRLDTAACRNNLKNVSLVDGSEGSDGDPQYLKFVSEVVSSTYEPSMTLDGVNMDRNSIISTSCCEHIEKGHPCSCSINSSGDASEVCEPTSPRDDDDRKHKVSHVLEQNSSKGSQETDASELKDKRRKRPLLKTVASGTALVGVLYLLLHFSRRRNKEESSEPNSRRTQSKKLRGRDFSYGHVQNGRRVDSIYPSEKLKFKN
ncbi:putative glyoxylate/hydroxypyruvate reductase HPR3-like [Capsicum annuum]|uniref:protein OPAQUE10 n=1 Tax=Capsicum annuum TaxID=4072 RepID=UPI0007BFEA48|nr:protein OPAQUE10 [Capsicum annuum]KAF3639415.1 putative glyoxylate/hydroxypyruvate reductase HPR3-like [Capsicum annuum]KAF3666881.1 putative glyoxylate/hydroxypyruvate reductase HPR3-like [Capsicum annuum]